MRLQLLSKHLIWLVLVFQGLGVHGQFTGRLHTGMGMHNASQGLFVRPAGLIEYAWGDYGLEGGLQFDLAGQREVVFSGLKLALSRDMLFREHAFGLTFFYLYTPFSDLLVELNRGGFVRFDRSRFSLELGTHLRTYAFRREAIDRLGLTDHTRLHEWNLYYRFRYAVKPLDHHWNIAFSLTNADLFLINQETNPALHIGGIYQLSDQVQLLLDAGYQQAGMFNISVHYFGFFIRPGLIWHLH